MFADFDIGLLFGAIGMLIIIKAIRILKKAFERLE